MDIIRVYDELLGSYKFKIDEGSNC